MSTLLEHLDRTAPDAFGHLADGENGRALGARIPVMATPAAVAAGVAVTAAAFGVGYAVEEAADG